MERAGWLFIGASLSVAVVSTALLNVVLHSRAKPSIQEVLNIDIECSSGKFGLKLPAGLPKLRALGEIEREEVVATEAWDDYTATHRVIHFKNGLALGYFSFSNDKNRYLLSSAIVSDARWNHISVFKIGASTETAERLLGTHASTDPELRANYHGATDELRFETSQGRIGKVIYSCYTG